MRKIILIMSVSLMFLGCKSVSTINREFENINYSDGINRQEAILIAQKHILDSGKKSLDISSATIENSKTWHRLYKELAAQYVADNFWIVRFGAKIGTNDWQNGLLLAYRYYVVVDKKTGNIVKEEEGLQDTL